MTESQAIRSKENVLLLSEHLKAMETKALLRVLKRERRIVEYSFANKYFGGVVARSKTAAHFA